MSRSKNNIAAAEIKIDTNIIINQLFILYYKSDNF